MILINNIERGEIYLANLNPVMGSEQGGIRPVLILQNDVGNYYSDTTIVASMTSFFRNKKHIPTHFVVTAREELRNDSIVLLEQIRTISKSRLIKKIGKLSIDEMNALNKCLFISVGISS
ncbi:MAG: type II toxin-antitoxin system PemK/MazF family toxin [Erysipelotrichales bacterium]|nr:type II toxin-antitoxin system PemK/MazF family toxin [Erysipelotrichales bacterium]